MDRRHTISVTLGPTNSKHARRRKGRPTANTHDGERADQQQTRTKVKGPTSSKQARRQRTDRRQSTHDGVKNNAPNNAHTRRKATKKYYRPQRTLTRRRKPRSRNDTYCMRVQVRQKTRQARYGSTVKIAITQGRAGRVVQTIEFSRTK